EPVPVGDRGRDDVVVVTGRIELLTQVRDVGVVDVVPLHTRAWGQPEEAGVQTAAQVKHDGLRVDTEELASPVVEVRGAGRHRRRVRGRDRRLFPVVVDAVDNVLG